jgi:hypothetical protein
MTAQEEGNDQEAGLPTRLLGDIRVVFAACGDPEALATEQILAGLKADSEAPWGEYGTAGLTARAMQLLLKDFGISSSNRRFRDGSQRRGFTRNQFADAWARYCPRLEQPAATGG